MRLRRKASVTSGRRQRRPADSASPGSQTFAYRSRRSEEEINTGRELSRETTATNHLGRFLLKRFGLVVLLVALLISTVNVLSLSNNARVMPLTGNNANSFLHDQSDYEAAASKLLAGSIWNRNKITVNTSSINEDMLKQFPELSSVSVTLPLLSKRPIVYVQTAQPVLVLAAQNGSFIVDTTGKALLPANQLKSSNTLPTVTDQSGLRVSLNHQALTSGNVSFIQTVLAQLAARHFTVESMTLPVGTSELDVKLAGQPYIIKFNLESGSARQQAGTFLATQSKLKSQNITPAQYVDVRVDGRAYYK
jgi:hypothetical protein